MGIFSKIAAGLRRTKEAFSKKFYELFHAAYVRPNINAIQKGLDYKNYNLDNIIRSNKDQITKRDVEIWVKNGLLEDKAINLDKSKKDDENNDLVELDLAKQFQKLLYCDT